MSKEEKIKAKAEAVAKKLATKLAKKAAKAAKKLSKKSKDIVDNQASNVKTKIDEISETVDTNLSSF